MTTKSAVRSKLFAQRRRMSFAARALDTMGAMATSLVPTMPGSSSGRPAPETTASTPAATAVRIAST